MTTANLVVALGGSLQPPSRLADALILMAAYLGRDPLVGVEHEWSYQDLINSGVVN